MIKSYGLKIVLIGTMILLIFGVFNLPYGFYDLLRDSVFWGSIYIIYKIKDINEDHILIFIILFGLGLIIFNPILKLELTKGIWIVIDILYALIYGLFYLYCINHDYI